MAVVATEVLQTGRETVDSEPIETEEVDSRDVIDEGGMEQPASAAMRHQVFQPVDDAAAEPDRLREAITKSNDISRLARVAKVGRQTIYDFLSGAVLHPKTRKKIESALRKIAAGLA